MYSQLHAEVIRTRQQEVAARTIRPQDVQDIGAGVSSRSGHIRRRAGKAAAALGVCIAAASVVSIGDASAHPRAGKQRNHVTAQQLQREMNALETVGFVASSCEVGGTLMTNYSTNQSVLLTW
jgi:hypothetical protein